jgi:hypothetical protein
MIVMDSDDSDVYCAVLDMLNDPGARCNLSL